MHVVPIKSPQGLHGKSAIFRDCTVFYFSWVCSRLKVILKYQISRKEREFSDGFNNIFAEVITIIWLQKEIYNKQHLLILLKLLINITLKLGFFFSACIITSATYIGLKLSSLGVYILFPSTAHCTPHRSNRKGGKNRWEIKFIFLRG